MGGDRSAAGWPKAYLVPAQTKTTPFAGASLPRHGGAGGGAALRQRPAADARPRHARCFDVLHHMSSDALQLRLSAPGALVAGPQDPYALVAWGGAEAATSPHLGTRSLSWALMLLASLTLASCAGGERYPVWNELLSFPLDSPSGSPLAPDQSSLRISLRHHSMTVFQRDSVIAEATVPLPAPEALASPGARPMCLQENDCASLRVVALTQRRRRRRTSGAARAIRRAAPASAPAPCARRACARFRRHHDRRR